MLRGPLALFLALGLGAAVPAQATTFLIFNGSTGVFGNDLVDDISFNDSIDLTGVPAGWLISATISSTYQNGSQSDQDIDFGSVMLNGIEFTVGTTGQNEFRFINNAIVTGNSNLFTISGTSGAQSSYSGTINVAPVPEPATWAMMICGFGMIAASLRRSWRRAGQVLRTA